MKSKTRKKSSVVLRKRRKSSSSKSTKSVKQDDVKYLANFLSGQSFKGQYYQEGDTLEVPYYVAKGYARRRTIRFDKIK